MVLFFQYINKYLKSFTGQKMACFSGPIAAIKATSAPANWLLGYIWQRFLNENWRFHQLNLN